MTAGSAKRATKSCKRTAQKAARKRSQRRPQLWPQYLEARDLALAEREKEAREAYERLAAKTRSAEIKSLIQNDLGVLDAICGKVADATVRFGVALDTFEACSVARTNLSALNTGSPTLSVTESDEASTITVEPELPPESCKVAILSFLFNWPSTGGGIIHTVELGRFLANAGFRVQHIVARYEPWRIGRVEEAIETPLEVLQFSDSTWNVKSIQSRFRQTVESLDPDWVIITDSWNFKPLLAEAVCGYPYILRQQALECLCPLNNIRLLVEDGGPDGAHVRQCPQHQLATPSECQACVERRGMQSGDVHRLDRTISGFGTKEYDQALRTAFLEAESVFVLNPLIEAMLAPYCRDVRVVTWGMDPARFPWPWENEPERLSDKTTFVMAGLVQEMIKGFHVLQEACSKLWDKRQDFEVVATGEPAGRVNAFTRFVGWRSQQELPRYLRAADVLVMPTIAQEGLGRTTVEAMACGRPVIASRIGGLPSTVQHGATGLLCEPGNAHDLAAKMARLLDNPAERERMGQLGREQFEERFSWDKVIQRDYRPVLTRRPPVAARGTVIPR